MKAIAIFFIFSSALTAFGQGVTSSSMPKIDSSQKGAYIGLDYMNLTDAHIDISVKSSSGRTYKDNSEGGTHLGMAGVRMGYNSMPEQGFGFDAGVRLLESFNSSEYGDNKIQMILPEVNAKFSFVRSLAAYAGLNVSKWTGSHELEKYQPRLGGQAGLSFRFSNAVALNAGYTVMNQKYEDDSYGSKIEADIQMNGFNTNLNYTF